MSPSQTLIFSFIARERTDDAYRSKLSVTDGPDGVAVVIMIIENGEGAISPICWHEEETLSELIPELWRFLKQES